MNVVNICSDVPFVRDHNERLLGARDCRGSTCESSRPQ